MICMCLRNGLVIYLAQEKSIILSSKSPEQEGVKVMFVNLIRSYHDNIMQIAWSFPMYEEEEEKQNLKMK